MRVVNEELVSRIRRRLGKLYDHSTDALVNRLFMMVGRYGVGQHPVPASELWNEKDVVLITYADMVQAAGERPLVSLRHFCERHLAGAIKTVHLLPFYPWSSDEGFSVIDYREVYGEYGTWDDVEKFGSQFRLMFDLVLNHCSVRSRWFRDFVNGVAPGNGYFLERDPDEDLSAVVRPRPWPLLTRTQTRRGDTWVWTTFSEDQVDLDWSNPDLLFEFIDIIMLYVSKGVRVLRLDAVAFLWKEAGTSCIHLENTHEVVKLLRDFLALLAPEVVVITETNVPHEENISYFGEGDEAHMVYQFALPPLLLYSLLREDCTALRDWAANLDPPPAGCTYFNFTASHDGIGVRPLQGLIDESEQEWLISEVRKRGGKIGERDAGNGKTVAYEMNITYPSALAEFEAASDEDLEQVSIRRFLCSQAVMLSMRGVPAIYFHSLLGSLNDIAATEAIGGEPRSINRSKWIHGDLADLLIESDTRESRVFGPYSAMLRRRADLPAFHPDAEQEILDFGPAVFAFLRTSLDGTQSILCVFNFTGKPHVLPPSAVESALGVPADDRLRNLMTGLDLERSGDGTVSLAPHESGWISGA